MLDETVNNDNGIVKEICIAPFFHTSTRRLGVGGGGGGGGGADVVMGKVVGG